MTTSSSLFASPAAEISYDRLHQLVEQGLPEGLTLEYKQEYSRGLVTTVAAMANTYGGLILVGVRDGAGPGSLMGVPESAILQIANACHDGLEPPWEPEIIPVPTEGKPQRFILVLRIDPSRAPRPVFKDGHAPIRLQAGNTRADRSRLAQLFAEQPALLGERGYFTSAPQLPIEANGSTDVDFLLRSGLRLPVDASYGWRPLAERLVGELADVLNAAPIQAELVRWSSKMGISAINPFGRHGHNRSRHAQLVWRAATETARHPVEARLVLDLEAVSQGPAHHLTCSLEMLLRARSYMSDRSPEAGPVWRLSLPDLYESVDMLTATLISEPLVTALAALAGIDPILVLPPSELHFVTGVDVVELLNTYGLSQIPEAGSSRGAHLIADPALDVRDPAQRRVQLDDWMTAIALDAGMSGMENLLEQYHATRD